MQGAVQKIYYLHVPAALGAYIAVSLTALASIVFLWLHDERADRLAEASAEVGLMFLFVVLTTGPIWGDASGARTGRGGTCGSRSRCSSAFVVAAYLVLRGAIEDEAMRGRYSAVLGVLARAADPVHSSERLSVPDAHLHPMPIALKPGEPSMSPEMMWTFFPGDAACSRFLCIAFIRARYRLERAARPARRARGRTMQVLIRSQTYHVVYVWVTRRCTSAYTVSPRAFAPARLRQSRASRSRDERDRLSRRRGPGRSRAAHAARRRAARDVRRDRLRRAGQSRAARAGVGARSRDARRAARRRQARRRERVGATGRDQRAARSVSRARESASCASRAAIRSCSGAAAKKRRRSPRRRFRSRSCRA